MRRKYEEDKLKREQKCLEQRELELQRYDRILAERKMLFKQTEIQPEQHKVFSKFLDNVIGDKRGINETFANKTELVDRFSTLKKENIGLLVR